VRLVTAEIGGRRRLGAVAEGKLVVDLPLAAREAGLADWPDDLDMPSFLALGEGALETARRLLERVGLARSNEPYLFPLDEARLLAPVPNPSKVVAIGLNYSDHAREQGTKPPDRPMVFAKFPTSVIGPGESITWDPALTAEVDYEAELAFVIGSTARRVRAEDAYRYVAGYTCLNDVSARDLQFGDRQWVRGKSLDTFCPMGPWLVTRDELPDPHALAIRCTVNAELLQDSSTGGLIFGVPELVAFLSRAFTLLPGDVVATGTPSGVGVFRKPPRFLKDEDVVAVEIEGIGRLENPCRTLA
jgi:2-keto-4-pentenoate hydratase/2-oxohepta-3-ene-1,7-dioic acid hydratase in catechol pathway